MRAFAPTLGRTVRVVDLHNTVHVTSEGDTFLSVGADCARSIIDRFTAAPARLRTMNVSCAATIPPIHTPGEYPRTLASSPRAAVVAAHDPGNTARRAAWVAAQTAADAAIRYYYVYVNGPGLRGGGFTVAPLKSGAYRFTLHRDRFVGDAASDGTFTWNPANNAIHGTITVHVGARRYRVGLSWTQRSTYARASVGGRNADAPVAGPVIRRSARLRSAPARCRPSSRAWAPSAARAPRTPSAPRTRASPGRSRG